MPKFFKVGIVLSFVAVLALPNVGSAVTAEELRLQIDELTREIQRLQIQLRDLEGPRTSVPTLVPTPSPGGFCHDFKRNLRRGDQGSEVAALHTALTKEGFTIQGDEIAGQRFGETTFIAVKGFQEKYRNEILVPVGLDEGTGFVGLSTRAKLNALYACTASVPTTPPDVRGNVRIAPESLREEASGFSVRVCSNIDPRPVKNADIGSYAVSVSATREDDPVLGTMTKNGIADLTPAVGEAPRWCGRAAFAYADFSMVAGGRFPVRVAATDNYLRAVTVAQDFIVAVPGSAVIPLPSVTVLAPNGGETFAVGGTYFIRWIGKDFPANGVVHIDLDEPGASTPLFRDLRNDGTERWTVAAPRGPGNYTIRVSCGIPGSLHYCGGRQTPGVFDSSDAPFSIAGATASSPPDFYVGTNVTSDATGFDVAVCNSAKAGDTTAVSVQVRTTATETVGTPTPSSGTTSVPGSELKAGACRTIRNLYSVRGMTLGEAYHVVVEADSDGQIAESDEMNNTRTFAIAAGAPTAPSITVLSPNGGEIFSAGKTYTVTWKATGVTSVILSACFTANFGYTCSRLGGIPDAGINALGDYSWYIDPNAPYVPSNKEEIRIRVADVTSGTYDESDAPFSIVATPQPPTISHITPSSAAVGDTVTVVGSNFNQFTFVALNGATSIFPTSFTATSLQFTVPSSLGIGGYTLQVGEKGSSFPLSNAVSFTVISSSTPTPSLTVLAPNGGENITIGQNYEVKWQVTNPTTDAVGVYVALVAPGDPPYVPGATGVLPGAGGLLESGSYTWKAGSYVSAAGTVNAPAGTSYRVIAVLHSFTQSKALAQDTSDGYFTLSAPPTTTTTTTSCPAPYHVLTFDGRCVWSCGAGTQPSNTTNECVCQAGYVQTGTDAFGRRVCSAPTTSAEDARIAETASVLETMRLMLEEMFKSLAGR
ncbi:MAG: hypothetical protein HY436_01075 [Candidatus Liptonbacteria bacterium]|nr:hypothetical protein [Candidatus Liptonbacteria bacterium]